MPNKSCVPRKRAEGLGMADQDQCPKKKDKLRRRLLADHVAAKKQGIAAEALVKLGDDSYLVYDWDGRKQMKRKDCKLDWKACNCKDETCADNLGCEECLYVEKDSSMETTRSEKKIKGKGGKDGIEKVMAVCKEMPKDRMVITNTLDPKINKECHYSKYKNFPKAFPVPLWTANVLPALNEKLVALGAKMKACSTGVKPPTGKVPAKVAGGKKDGAKSCSKDADCASHYCKHNTFGRNECKPRSFVEGLPRDLKDGAECHRDWQCASGECPSSLIGGKKCAKTVVKAGTNTCKATLNELFTSFSADKRFQVNLKRNFDSAFGVMTALEAEEVCPGFKPTRHVVKKENAAETKVGKIAAHVGKLSAQTRGAAVGQEFSVTHAAAEGSCSPAEAFSIINGKNRDRRKGMAWYLIDYFARKLETFVEENQATYDAALSNLDPQDAYTIDYEANFAIGTTFGFNINDDVKGGGVGFCTPDTNNIQTLTPVVARSGSFGPQVREAHEGTTSVGFSILGHPVPQLGIGLTATRTEGKWTPELEFRIYLAKTGIGNGGEAGAAMSVDFAGGVVNMLGPILAPIITLMSELWFAADGNFDLAKAKVGEALDRVRKNPGEILGKLFLGAAVAGAGSYLAALAVNALAKAVGVAATSYQMLVIKATKHPETGKALWSAELATLRTVELTIGIPGAALKPMVGFGSSYDGGALINKHFSPAVKDAKTGKDLVFGDDTCAAVADKVRTVKDQRKGSPDMDTALKMFDCDEPDRRSKMCKACCELVGSVRPDLATERKLQTGDVCTKGLEAKHGKQSRGLKKWFCSGSDEAKEYYSTPDTGLSSACKASRLKSEGHGVSVDLCANARMELKTFLGCNTKSGFFGSVFGDDAGNSRRAFIRAVADYQLYEGAEAECKGENDPDCFNEHICRVGGIACFDGD
jgi:hypothetical protein